MVWTHTANMTRLKSLVMTMPLQQSSKKRMCKWKRTAPRQTKTQSPQVMIKNHWIGQPGRRRGECLTQMMRAFYLEPVNLLAVSRLAKRKNKIGGMMRFKIFRELKNYSLATLILLNAEHLLPNNSNKPESK